MVCLVGLVGLVGEAEYFGAMLALKDLIWLRDLLFDLGLLVSGPTVMYCDSQSAVGMALDPIAFKKTKAISVKLQGLSVSSSALTSVVRLVSLVRTGAAVRDGDR